MPDRYFIDFNTPIRFTIKITKISKFDFSLYGSRIFIRGETNMNDKLIEVEFFCPNQLEFILREMHILKGETIEINYFGCKNIEGKSSNTPEQLYFVERIGEKDEIL